MKRLLACAAVVFVLLSAGCGNDPAAAPTPQPVTQTQAPTGGILAPADQADEVVDDMNQRTTDVQQQPNLDQRTGSGYGANSPTPPA